MYFDFNEINIMMQNMNSADREEFLKQLDMLGWYTQDLALCRSILGLREKICELTDEEFQGLFQDIKAGDVSTIEGYVFGN